MTEHYEVIIPQALLDRLRAWAGRARDLNCDGEFLTALKLMNRRLEQEADSWGDPLFNYPEIQAVHCRGMIANWFFAWYGVHVASRSVLVRDIAFAPGCALE